MAGIFVYSEDVVLLEQLLSVGRKLADALSIEVTVATMYSEEISTDEIIAYGADHVNLLKGKNTWPESYAEAIYKQIAQENPSLTLIGGTLRGKEIAAKIATWGMTGLVNSATDLRVIAQNIESDRLLYGGLAVCTEELCDGCVVTVEPRVFEVAVKQAGRKGSVSIVEAETSIETVVGAVCPIVHQRADLTIAEKIVCVGRGLNEKNDMKLAENLAEELGAEIGCTRSIAEDYNWLPTEVYIGLSGQKVKPKLYLSIGVSGQVQHIVGARDAKIIVAIDKNEKAPIFAAADYGIVGDLYEIVPTLIEKLKNR